MNVLLLVAVAASVLALAISIINAVRISSLKKKCEVDSVNHSEDVNLSMESVKLTVSREVKNLRKEMNKRQRASQQPQQPQKPRTNPNQQKVEGEKKVEAGAEGEKKTPPKRNYRKPPYKARKKPILKEANKEPEA